MRTVTRAGAEGAEGARAMAMAAVFDARMGAIFKVFQGRVETPEESAVDGSHVFTCHHSKPEPFWPKFTVQKVHKFVVEPILFAICGRSTFVPCSFGASVPMRCRAVGIAWRRTGSCSW